MHHTDGLWNGIWSDLFIESTYMRYGYGPSGIIGATLSNYIRQPLPYGLCRKTQWDKWRMMSLNWSTTKNMLCCAKRKNGPFTSTTIHVTGRAFAKQSRHGLNSSLSLISFTGRVIDDTAVNVFNGVEIGTSQMRAYESNWPDGFDTA